MILFASNLNTKKAAKLLEASLDFLLASSKIYRSQKEDFSVAVNNKGLHNPT